MGDLIDGHEFSRTGRAFDFEIIAVVVMKFLQRLDEQEIHRHPDRPAPVGIAAKKPALRFTRPVADFVHHAAAFDAIRLLPVNFRKGANAVVAQELGLVEHPAEQTFHAMAAQQRQQAALASGMFLPARNQFREVRAEIEIPLHALGEAGEFFQQRWFEDFDGEQRNQPDHRADLHRHVPAVGQAKVVVIKFVLVVPQAERIVANAVDGGRDVEEMLEKLRRDVLINAVVLREFERDAHQVQAIHRHPARAVGLVDVAAGGQWHAPVENADVVEAEEAALKNVAALRVLAVHPPGEVEQKLVKYAFEKFQVAGVARIRFAAMFAVNLEHAPRCPRVDGRVHVAERPLVGGELAVRMHIPLAGELRELMLGKPRVQHRQRDAMERQVPRGIPRILPLVGHGHDAGVVKMQPLVVAALLPFGRRRRLGGVALQPFAHLVTVKLLAPDHPGERLALDVAFVGGGNAVLQLRVKIVGLKDAPGEDGIEVGKRKWGRRLACLRRARRRGRCFL